MRILCKGCNTFLLNLEELPRLEESEPITFQAPGGFPYFKVSPYEAEQIREAKRKITGDTIK